MRFRNRSGALSFLKALIKGIHEDVGASSVARAFFC